MPHPLPSSRRQRKLINITERLLGLFEALCDETVRRSTLPPALAGDWRRTLSEATRLLGPGCEVSPENRNPAEFFAATAAKLHALTELSRLQNKATRPKSRGSYPRCFRVE